MNASVESVLLWILYIKNFLVETPIFSPAKTVNMDKFTKKLTYALQNHFSVV